MIFMPFIGLQKSESEVFSKSFIWSGKVKRLVNLDWLGFGLIGMPNGKNAKKSQLTNFFCF